MYFGTSLLGWTVKLEHPSQQTSFFIIKYYNDLSIDLLKDYICYIGLYRAPLPGIKYRFLEHTLSGYNRLAWFTEKEYP